jgi:arsenite methyltransferase
MTADHGSDRWARWITRGRDAGDAAREKDTREFLAPIRDRVLAGARLTAGSTLLDVGTGDGLLGLGALPLVGPGGTVVFSDVSADLLAICRANVPDGEEATCRYVRTSASALAVAGGAVDAVTTRSVLIYVPDKRRAFAELFRVLAPGGRLSIYEPISRFGNPEPSDRLWGFPVGEHRDLADRVKAAYRSRKPPEQAAMSDFDERDLLRHAVDAGFVDLHLNYEARVTTWPLMPLPSIDTMLDSAPNPLAPTYRQLLHRALSPDEAQTLIAHVGAALAARDTHWRFAWAYLTGTKPGRLPA